MKRATADKRSSRKKEVWSTTQDGRRGGELVNADSEYTPISSTCVVPRKEIYNDATMLQGAGEPGPHDGQISGSNSQSFAVGTCAIDTQSRLPNSESIATLPPSTRHAIR